MRRKGFYMLKSLTVSNFKIFESPVTIDFSATGNYAFNKDAVKDGISKTSVMYGKNASGKSSIALALFDIVANLTDNYISPKDYAIYLNASSGKPAEFKYVFTFDGKDVVYEYKKTNIFSIISEKLTINGKTVVLYDGNIKHPVFEVNLPGTERLNKNPNALQISALKWVKSNSILEKSDENILFEKMFAFVNKMLLFWSLQDRSFVGYSPVSNLNITEQIVRQGHFSKLQKFFKEAGIKDEITHLKHNGSEHIALKIGKQLLDFTSASSQGMKSLLLFFSWLGCCKNETEMPSFVCIDEFDAYYHYELSYFIIEFLKKLNCQALITTHNTAILTNDLLRPDCYFICTKEKITNVHNATEKEIREGHNLEKLYRGGTFGK